MRPPLPKQIAGTVSPVFSRTTSPAIPPDLSVALLAQRTGDLGRRVGHVPLLLGPLPEPSPERCKGHPENGGDDDQENPRVRETRLRVPVLYLVRDQDEAAEDRAGGEPAPRTGLRADVVEAGRNTADDPHDREHEVHTFGDAQ